MEFQHIHPEPTSFLRRYVFSTDHKWIAKQFLWAGLLFLAFGGVLAMMIRWQWAHALPEPVPVIGALFLKHTGGLITPPMYNTIFTMHGLIMIFFAITPILIGAFGNYCIPLMIGARDMAFPKLNMLSFWTFLLSQCLIIASFFVPLGSAAAGWTTYPPLSTNVGTPGLGQTLVVLAVFVTGVATIMGGINYVTTVIRLRAPGMTYFRMPATVWGLWLTAILNVLFVPVLGSAALLLTLDRVFGTNFFMAGAAVTRGGGDPILFQHLFWIFGHPEVYILILPGWGIVTDLMSFFARKPAYWYKGSVLAMTAVTALSAVVYGHHMFVTGMNPLLGQGFMLLTLIISVPAEVLFLNWLHTLWKGSIRLTVPMLFALGMVFVFGLGGLTGLYLGTISTDLYLHDTMWVVGHFHLTMAAASFLASFAAIYFWFPKMFGRQMNTMLGKLHFWFSTPLITLVFCGQLAVGYAGQQRRLYIPYSYDFLKHLLPWNQWTSYLAFILGASQFLFVVNFFWSVFAGKKAEVNPWQVGTLEWTVPSPPPHHNYDKIPTVVRGPHEYANPEVRKALGRDWIGQTEDLPSAAPAGAALATAHAKD
ncbi:MAG TPA: cbb3-type cytochrome c oxidase subunit I [Myxococcota bacterium]|jgi:cytochrome c oxidase subunit 1|nr:cbb3-type cytochrome c oxidase subunit I [Myxococcota bacterium]